MLKNFHRPLWQRLLHWGHASFAMGLLSVAAVAYLLLNYYYIDGYGYGYFMTAFGYSLAAISFAILVIAALSPDSLLHRLRIPGAAQLAAWSYAIYLSHKAIAFILQKQLTAQGLEISSGVMLLIVMLACLLGGWLLYRLVETPFMNVRDRYFPQSFSEHNATASTESIIQAKI
jgi:peptidoglycan/LPS O-acetylase OafA/YrhL